ncbi:MAG: hypothetical protein ACOYOS_20210 [Syntrophales bacterium]
MRFKTIMMAACAALAVISIEPATGLLKLSVALAGAAVGAVIADPLAEETADLKKQVAAIKDAVTVKREPVPFAAVAEG